MTEGGWALLKGTAGPLSYSRVFIPAIVFHKLVKPQLTKKYTFAYFDSFTLYSYCSGYFFDFRKEVSAPD